jgi:molybdopterin molybdotransferase
MEARDRVLDSVQTMPVITLGLEEAAGYILASAVSAPHDLPRFDNSAMDGYALRAEDTTGAGENPVSLPVVGEVRAGGAEEPTVSPGVCVRIMTGAPLPAGADAVIPVELTEEQGESVVLRGAVRAGQHVRRAGEDIEQGDVAVASGHELGPGELAVLASVGAARVDVYGRPRVAVLVTGDELVDISSLPGPGQIRDSNSLALITLIDEAGGSVHFCERVPDDYAAALSSLERAADADLIVSSGGVSMGRYDLVRKAVEELGGIDFWKVAMKPGKPVVMGQVRGTPFLGLPGNPVSVHVAFEQFVRPAIRKMRGCRSLLRPTLVARLTESIEHPVGRLELVRVRLINDDGMLIAAPTGAQGSHIQSSLVDTHGLARFPAEEAKLEAGSAVVVEVWRLPEVR